MKQLAYPFRDEDPWLRHTRGSRLRLIAAYAIGVVVIAAFLILISFAGPA